jgi:DNA repair exonuclease SbcCD ATPase subunit
MSMTDAVTDTEPDDLQPALRSRLADAITRRDHERQRLAALEAAQSKAREQRRQIQSRLSDAQEGLRVAHAEERSALAYSFAATGKMDGADPVAAAQSVVSRCEAELDQVNRIEDAISGEIDQLQGTLRNLQHDIWRAAANLVVASDEYQLLIASHKAAWQQLRSVKTALRMVQSNLHGYLPSNFAEIADSGEPLEERVGYPVDQNLVGAWSMAVAELEKDPTVELPLFG